MSNSPYISGLGVEVLVIYNLLLDPAFVKCPAPAPIKTLLFPEVFEKPALFPIAGQTLEDTGFKIEKLSNGANPVYAIKYATNAHPVIGFSKTYDSSFNPASEFAAILTCSSADKGCPIIAGAEKRIPITYEDPKAFDNTPLQLEKYNERSLQIATEMKYVFSNIK